MQYANKCAFRYLLTITFLLLMNPHIHCMAISKNVMSSDNSASYRKLIGDLRNNWQSPILYLKKRGYIPKDLEQYHEKALASKRASAFDNEQLEELNYADLQVQPQQTDNSNTHTQNANKIVQTQAVSNRKTLNVTQTKPENNKQETAKFQALQFEANRIPQRYGANTSNTTAATNKLKADKQNNDDGFFLALKNKIMRFFKGKQARAKANYDTSIDLNKNFDMQQEHFDDVKAENAKNDFDKEYERLFNRKYNDEQEVARSTKRTNQQQYNYEQLATNIMRGLY